jgi:hypothetical protein
MPWRQSSPTTIRVAASAMALTRRRARADPVDLARAFLGFAGIGAIRRSPFELPDGPATSRN